MRDHEIGFALRKAHKRATAIFKEMMAEFSITSGQFAVLAKLDELGTQSQNQLGRLAALDAATASGVVGRLEKRGLVRRQATDKDARLMVIELTDEGRGMVQKMRSHVALVSARTMKPLTKKEAATLVMLLAKMS